MSTALRDNNTRTHTTALMKNLKKFRPDHLEVFQYFLEQELIFDQDYYVEFNDLYDTYSQFLEKAELLRLRVEKKRFWSLMQLAFEKANRVDQFLSIKKMNKKTLHLYGITLRKYALSRDEILKIRPA